MQVKGKLQVQVDDSRLTASLVFLPDEENGSLWTKPKIQNLLEEKGIVTGISEDAIDGALMRFADAEEGPVRWEVARGEEPQPPEVSFAWEECPIPEELTEAAERVLKTAPPPEITRTRTSREKVRKKVTKKPSLPFGKPKEETVERWETKKWEEPVEVDQTVLGSGWVDEGQLIASREEGGEGSSGMSVYGRRLPPPKESSTDFYPGRGVRLEKDGLHAEYAGFLRWGKNWAEVIPFTRHWWELTESKDRATCYLTFRPGEEAAPPPSPEAVLSAARELGYEDEELLSADDVQRMIRTAVKGQTEVKAEPITKAADGWYEIKVSDDRLKATLDLYKGSAGGTSLSLKKAFQEIREQKFKGLDTDQLKSDLLEFYRARKRELRDYLLAEGTAPTRGEDRTLEFTCEFLDEEETEQLRSTAQKADLKGEHPSLDEFPLEQVQRMARVAEGSVFGEFSAKDEGEPGIDVYGRTLEGQPGNDPALSIHEHVRLEGDRLYAEIDGVLDVGEQEEATALRVRRHREAQISVELSEDAMQAYLSLSEAEGSAEGLSLEQVSRALEQQGVVKGLNSAAISNALEKVKAGEEVQHVKVAEGIPPIDPGRSRLKFAVRRASGKSYTIREDGKADYKHQDHITTVEKDQLIGHIVSSETKPKDGWNVLGKTLPAKEPPPLTLEIGENIRQQEDEKGNVELYAEANGELYYDQRRIRVQTVHAVENDVDLHTGNINFPGEVQVRGNVTRGFYVMAGADVKIAGNIEAALVSSGRTVTVMQGIVGGNKAVIRAKENIETTFAEQATLLAVGDLKVKNSCLRCSIKCNGSVQLTTAKGELVGGEVQSRRGLEVEHLGNQKHVQTKVSFGQDYLVLDQIQKQEREIGRVKEKITGLDRKMREYERSGQRRELDRARGEKLKMMKAIEKRSMHLFSLRERYEEHFDSQVVVRGTVYPGVVLESHGRFLEISSEKKKVVFRFDENTGRILEQKLED
jgi:hypothetical protein